MISTSMGDWAERLRFGVGIGDGGGGGGGGADALGLGGSGSWRRVEEMEEGVGGLRAQNGWRSGAAGWGAAGGGAEVLFELVAVGGAELDPGGVAAQHRWTCSVRLG